MPSLRSHPGKTPWLILVWNMQPADVRQGMINIRSDEDASPEDVLEGMTPEQAAQVRLLWQLGNTEMCIVL